MESNTKEQGDFIKSHSSYDALEYVAQTENGKGTTFKILFPASKKATREELKQFVPPPKRNKTILLADDESSIRILAEQMLGFLGFEVITGQNGTEALALFEKFREKIDCIILDFTMPGLNGKEAFSEIRKIDSDISIIIASGYHEQKISQLFRGKNLSGFIQKPYQLKVLEAKINEVLGV